MAVSAPFLQQPSNPASAYRVNKTSSYISWICQRDKKLRHSWSRFSGNPAGGNITGQIFSLKYLPALEFIHNIHWQISTLQSMNHTFEKAHIFKFSQMDEMNVVI